MQEATGGIFNPKWQPGYTEEIPAGDLTAQISVSDAGQVTVMAGTFENCIKVTLTLGKTDAERGHYTYPGWNVGHDITDFYYAPNVGIIKIIFQWGKVLSANTELVSYSATGQGYMPVEVGNCGECHEMTLRGEGYSAMQKIKITHTEAGQYTITDIQECVFLGTEEEYRDKFKVEFPNN